MADTEDDGFTEEAFKGFGEDPATVATPSADAAKPDTPAEKPEGKAPVEVPNDSKSKESSDGEKDKPTDKPDSAAKSGEEKPTAGEGDKPADSAEKPGEKGKEPEATAPEVPKPLTEDGARSIFNEIRADERASSKQLEATTQEVLEAYYPDGLSDVLIDEQSGKELRTPQDVVDATGGEMDIEQAAQWLMNEQYKLDQSVDQIRNDAEKIAETTVNFKHDAITAVQKYEPLFKAYPYLQEKVFNKLMKLVKADEKKGVILSTPDVLEFYDDALEPYQLAFEHSTQTSATNPTAPEKPEPPKPTAEDRMDVSGDGGASAPANDPNDFAQQVSKELAKGA